MEIKTKKRDSIFDIVRALCAIEIIAFWHLSNYLPEAHSYSPQTLHIGEIITWGCLACFTFMSGFFLSKYKTTSLADVVGFYKKRLTRFYIIYLLSAGSLFIGGLLFHQPFFTDTKQFILTILGLGCFNYPYPPTLWYFCMIMFFYMITPLLSLQISNKWRYAIGGGILLTLLIIKFCGILNIDERLIVYFPFYLLGLFIDKSAVEKVKNIRLLPITFIPWLLAIIFIKEMSIYEGIVLDVLLIMSFISLASLLDQSKALVKFFSFISTGSMVAYLFHRHFYLVAVIACNLHNMSNLRDASIPVPVAVCVVIPLIFIISYFVQKIYDFVINKLSYGKS